ncbi:MAG TPA: isochorismatase family cysteine hydrolase [Candidatus Tectomicrobia bacterium]
MATSVSADHHNAAILCMDYQNDIVGAYADDRQHELLSKAAAVLSAARRTDMPVIYVVVRFRNGYPEISPRNRLFQGIKSGNRLRDGTAGAEIHREVAPQADEIIVTKRRVGAFSTTDLETVLKSQGITHLVLMGIATSGVVLSTVRWAADADYEITVLSDCCADADEEVHRVLTQKIFPRQATVVASAEWLQTLA